MLILGIETSCDETAASLVEAKNGHLIVKSNVISSQIALHAKWGGVVPNLAAREHLKNILPVIEAALEQGRKKISELDLIAVTNGPGLIPALLIGTTTAKTLAYLWKKPLIGIHHIEGHIYANLVHPTKKDCSDSPSKEKRVFRFPALCLVVSGGHTQLVLLKNHLSYQIIGETLDDAVGEAFDKVARTLGLDYPGGPIIEKNAAKINPLEKKFNLHLPRPMLKSPNFDFSFSGIKTAVLYLVRDNPAALKDERFIWEMCHEFQTAVFEVLIKKTMRAVVKFKPKTILLAGGVSANQTLREKLGQEITSFDKSLRYLTPDRALSLDNGAMIAGAAYFHWKQSADKKKLQTEWKDLKTNPNLKLIS